MNPSVPQFPLLYHVKNQSSSHTGRLNVWNEWLSVELSGQERPALLGAGEGWVSPHPTLGHISNTFPSAEGLPAQVRNSQFSSNTVVLNLGHTLESPGNLLKS